MAIQIYVCTLTAAHFKPERYHS